MSSDLFEGLDILAAALLEGAKDKVTVDEAGETIMVSLSERLKVFAELAKYAELRARREPPKKKESKFDAVRAQFNGTGDAPAGRARRGSARGAPPSASDSLDS